jgi:hypothetical protein
MYASRLAVTNYRSLFKRRIRGNNIELKSGYCGNKDTEAMVARKAQSV